MTGVKLLIQGLSHSAVFGVCEVAASASFQISPGDIGVTLGQEERGS